MRQGGSAMRVNSEVSKTTRRRNRTGKAAWPGARTPRWLQFEPLEDRTLLAVTATLSNATPWTPVGPVQISNGQIEGMGLQGNNVAGAVVAFVTAPDGTIYAGTANGGVWKATSIAATSVDLNQINDPDLPAAPA